MMDELPGYGAAVDIARLRAEIERLRAALYDVAGNSESLDGAIATAKLALEQSANDEKPAK